MRKMHPPTSPVPSCSSSASSSRRSILENEDSKPHIPTAGNKLTMKKSAGSRVVPFNCIDNMDENDAIKDDFENEEELEDVSLIRRQLQQIENQQSNLLNLLQVVAKPILKTRCQFLVHCVVLH